VGVGKVGRAEGEGEGSGLAEDLLWGGGGGGQDVTGMVPAHQGARGEGRCADVAVDVCVCVSE